MRVLVTGSRVWPDEAAVHEVLDEVMNVGFDGDTITVVHGACPTGADLYASTWKCKNPRLKVIFEPHPADWDKYGKAAGPVRNTEMVAKGADLMIAFFMPGSRGTMDCYCKGKLAGIYSWEMGEL